MCGYIKSEKLFLGLTLSTAEAVLQKMDDMQKMRRRLRSRNRDRDAKDEVITYRGSSLYCVIIVFMYI